MAVFIYCSWLKAPATIGTLTEDFLLKNSCQLKKLTVIVKISKEILAAKLPYMVK
jgi:hypothetical protein